MKYLIRALKYFVYISLLAFVILAALAALGFVSSDINVMFSNGWNSVLKILLMFFLASIIYPRFGFVKRGVIIPGEYSEIRPGVVAFMEERGYQLESEEGENMNFRLRNKFNRVTRMLEDRISLTRDYAGFYMEGPAKDIARLANGLEYRFRNPEEN